MDISTAADPATPPVDASAAATPTATPANTLRPATRRMLEAPILPTILRLALPNVVVMVAQSATGLVETWFVSRLGTDALTGMAVVFPGFMLVQMLSAGAVGGGIASSVARALGAGRREDADATVLHALFINALLGIVFSALFIGFGRTIYGAMGAHGASLDAAMAYSNVVFGGAILVWVGNALASVLRGTGNMWLPSLANSVGLVLLVPLSPLLIFGLGPVPAMGIAGGAIAVLLTQVLSAAAMAWYLLSGRALVKVVRARLRTERLRDILRVGAVASISTLQTTLIFALTTAMVGRLAGPAAVAGYGTGARLEYLLIPLVFGIGAPLVAMVGTNVGAGNHARALRIGLTGGMVAFVATEAVGLAAALFPGQWLGLFGDDPGMLAMGTIYLRTVGPAYGFFGMGLALYFASQGAGRLRWPIGAGFLRLFLAVGGGSLAYSMWGTAVALFSAVALGLVVYGLLVAVAVACGVWFEQPSPRLRLSGRLG